MSNGSQLAVVRPSLPAAPERSHVSVPTRSGIRRSGDVGRACASARGDGDLAIPNRSGLGRGNVIRPSATTGGSAPVARNSEPASRQTDATTAPAVRGARPNLASPRNTTEAEPIRPNGSGFRSFARPSTPAARGETEVALNNSTPTPAPRSEVREPQSRTCADGHHSEFESPVQSRASVTACCPHCPEQQRSA